MVVAVLVALAGVLAFAPDAGAHTEFESSDPTDGAVLADPIGTVTVVFTATAEPAGNGFEVLDPSGAIRTPSAVSSTDGRTWVLEFDEPLAGGTVGVRWKVAAGDAHPIEGSFSFTAGALPGVQPIPSEAPAAADTADPSVATDSVEPGGSVESDDLDAFLDDGGGGSAAGLMAAIGRILRLLGSVIGLGALAFAAYVLRGGRNETGRVLMWIRRCSLLVVVGAVVVWLAEVMRADGGSWSALWSPSTHGDLVTSSLGLSLGLSLVGGVALGLGAVDRRGDNAADTSGPQVWRPTALAVIGSALVLASFLFDGHTVTEGNRVVTAISDVVHVAAAAVWAGGVAMLWSVVRHRRSRTVRTDTAVLGARFSVVATYALGAAGLAGVALAVAVLDAPSELWSSSWGRLLLLKLALVGAAVAAGAHNRYVSVPALESDPEDRLAVRRFGQVLGGEVVVLLGVVVVTGLLVGAQP